MDNDFDTEYGDPYIDWNEENDYLGDEETDDEPDLDFGFEHDSAMTSIGWGTDEDYGYFGGDDY